MASPKAISIELGKTQRTILQQQLNSGRYENASEVVSDALKLMRQRDVVFDEWLRSDVLAAIADKRAPAPIDEVFKRVRSRVARKAKAAKSGA
ncbi:ribbon-helix-helix domain-containing protein [Bradyrhizobium sp.]|jgi:antitoxin ParD1/3/4|uniref:ribbon-helix-helix domain-containing protein n=1 Tax=Bradyrhizobium sp. TaxID=376 RepID=UPI003C1CE8EA